MIPYKSNRPTAVPRTLEAYLEITKAIRMLCGSQQYTKASADDQEHPGWPAGTADGRGGKFRPNNGATVVAARGKRNEAECDAQFKQDKFICNLVRTPLCWAQAMERYAAA